MCDVGKGEAQDESQEKVKSLNKKSDVLWA